MNGSNTTPEEEEVVPHSESVKAGQESIAESMENLVNKTLDERKEFNDVKLDESEDEIEKMMTESDEKPSVIHLYEGDSITIKLHPKNGDFEKTIKVFYDGKVLTTESYDVIEEVE